MKQRKSDILWKVVIEDVFADLLRFIFSDADEVYNMDRGFVFLDKELAELDPQPDEEKDSRFADKLVKVYHRDGAEEWVLLHIEIQGDTAVPVAFAERMYTYFYRIRDRYRKPVSAIAIFTGQDGREMPNRYAYHYRGTRLTYEYPTISVLDYSDEELESSHNPFAQVIIAARIRLLEQKIPEEELLNIKLLAARKLYAKGFDRDKIRAVFTFLRNYVLFEKPEMNRKFDDLFAQTDKTSVMNTVEYLRMEGREEGLAEGLKKGLERGKREGKKEATRTIVENLLRNSDYPIEKIASSCGVSIDFVNDIKKKIL